MTDEKSEACLVLSNRVLRLERERAEAIRDAAIFKAQRDKARRDVHYYRDRMNDVETMLEEARSASTTHPAAAFVLAHGNDFIDHLLDIGQHDAADALRAMLKGKAAEMLEERNHPAAAIVRAHGDDFIDPLSE